MPSDIEKLIEKAVENSVIEIPAGEYEGGIVIGKSCTIRGNGAVIWSVSGPALIVNAENVHIENLKILLTGNKLPYSKKISVYCHYPDTKFAGVEVNGAVIGIPDEEQYWGIPAALSLGTVPAEKETSFAFEVYVPTDADINCGMYCLRLSQNYLFRGYNNVSFTVDKLKSGALIYGEIFVVSSVTGIIRKITVSGFAGEENSPPPANYMLFTADREAPEKHGKMIENFDPLEAASTPEPEPEKVEIPPENDIVLEEINEAEFGGDIREENVFLVPEQRIPLLPRKYCIEVGYKSTRAKLDIDGYLFMLGASGRVESNSGMIFFGNDHSKCGSVRYINSPDRRAMVIDLGTIPESIKRMVLLFSIYGSSPMQTFDKLVEGEIKILCENGVCLHLKLEKNIRCRTILALGFDRNDGVWELIPSGKGVSMPLEDICRSYGVTII